MRPASSKPRQPGPRRPLYLAVLLTAGAGLWLMGRRAPATGEAAAITPVSPSIVLAPDGAGETGAKPEQAPDLAGFLDELTREFPFGRERQSVLREILEDAPPEAVEALLRLSFGADERNDLTHVLLERLAELAPEAALAFGRGHGFGENPPWWHSVIGGLADPLVATPDILCLPISTTRESFLGHMAMRAALVSPEAALAFANGLQVDAEHGLAIANAIAGAGRRDAAVGFELAVAHASETVGAPLLRGMAADWAMNDYAAAAGRVRELPPGEARQAALAGLAAVAIDRDFSGAWPLVAEITDASVRRDLYGRLAQAWLLRDPAAASAWAESTPELDDEARARVRDLLRRSGRAP